MDRTLEHTAFFTLFEGSTATATHRKRPAWAEACVLFGAALLIFSGSVLVTLGALA